jgi:hypothetical protein
MRRWILSLTLCAIAFLPAGCVLDIYSKQVESESDRESHEFATRLDAAMGVQDVTKRDDALARVARDAAKRGRVGVVKRALTEMSVLEKHDATASEAALTLAGVNTGEDAVPVAKTIANQSLRDDTLAKIAAQLKRE